MKDANLTVRVTVLKEKTSISWDISIKLFKSLLIKGVTQKIIWRVKLWQPYHLSLSQVKLLNDLYVEVHKKKWMISNPYAEAIKLHNHLYPNGHNRDESSLSRKEKKQLVQAEKP
jgi:hypothetical protein